MVERGGGVIEIRHQKAYESDLDLLKPDVILIELIVDVRESMGANLLIQLAEVVGNYLVELIGEGRTVFGGKMYCSSLPSTLGTSEIKNGYSSK
jgi:hydroxymethylglutaryl-CoA reductase